MLNSLFLMLSFKIFKLLESSVLTKYEYIRGGINTSSYRLVINPSHPALKSTYITVLSVIKADVGLDNSPAKLGSDPWIILSVRDFLFFVDMLLCFCIKFPP